MAVDWQVEADQPLHPVAVSAEAHTRYAGWVVSTSWRTLCMALHRTAYTSLL